MLDHYWAWIVANKDWLFSGVAVAIVGALLRRLVKRKGDGVSLTNKAGASSQNIQAGRDVHLTVGEGATDTQSPRQRFVDELVTFCSESKTATTKLFLARRGDGTTEKQNAFAAAFMECERHDASSQRLQLRAKDTFPESGVQRELFELLRRTSLTRQSPAIAEEPYLARAFAADQSWVDAQVRRVISVAARAAGYDLDRGEVPFLIGFHPSFVGELRGEDTDGQPPSVQIMEEYSMARVKEQWEALGHKWDPSPFTRHGQTRQKTDSEPVTVPRRDSEPDVSDGRVRSSIPFEEKHRLWLAGYDSRPALVFADGVRGQLSIRLTTVLTEPLKALVTFDTRRHPIDLISPRVSAKAGQLLRAKSSSTFDRDVEALQEELRLSLTGDFAEYGYELVALSIHVRH
jgi:hypothetical protein